MLHWGGIEPGADFFQQAFARSLVAAVRFDLDEFVAGKAKLDFLDDVFSQAGIADHHDVIEMVCLGAQEPALFRVDIQNRISAKSVAL